VRPGILVAVLSAAGIGVSLMQTLIIPLIPELPKLLDASASDSSWAITATLLTAAVATPVFGRLGDMYGPKPMLVACAVLLTAGSLVAATTSSLIPFVLGRGLQGLALPIIPLGLSVLRASVPAARVGTATGLMSASLGVGGALGLPLSAAIAEQFSWHALFWFAAALGVAALLLFAFMVPSVPATSSDRLDPLGAVLLAAGLVTLLIGITKGQSWGWTSPTTLGLFVASLVIFAVSVTWQLCVESPIVDLRTTVRLPVLADDDGGGWLDRSAYAMCCRIDAAGAMALGELADEFQIDVPTVSRHVAPLLRAGMATGTGHVGKDQALRFCLTPMGRDRLHRQHGRTVAGPVRG